MATEPAMGIGLAVLSFSLIGLGVSARGTSLLNLDGQAKCLIKSAHKQQPLCG
jgi:hypothetical protein